MDVGQSYDLQFKYQPASKAAKHLRHPLTEKFPTLHLGKQLFATMGHDTNQTKKAEIKDQHDPDQQLGKIHCDLG